MVNFEKRYIAGLSGLESGKEIWFDHPTIDYLSVSNMGRVMFVEREVKYRDGRIRTYPERITTGRPFTVGSGYGQMIVDIKRNGKRGQVKYVHRLVLETFVGPCPKGMQCRHFPDRNPENNKLDNLSWGTPSQNCKDKDHHGTNGKGETNPRAKLKNSDISRIHRLYRGGLSQQDIASLYGVVQGIIGVVLNKKSFTDSQPEDKTIMRNRGSKGSANGNAALRNPEDREKIMQMYENGMSSYAISKVFKVDFSTIKNFVTGKTYRD